MTMPTFHIPVRGPRLVPLGQDRGPADVLPNGRPAFRVTSPFGPRTRDGKPELHDGLDIGNWNAGDEVLAMAAGTVAEVVPLPFGIVRVNHPNGWSSGYAHMTNIAVVRHQPVNIGTVLGRVGAVGTADAHLHFDITHGTTRLDPWPLLAQNRPQHRFSDVPPDHRFHAAIEWAAAERLIFGLDDGTYRPDAALTRGQLAVILHRYHQRFGP